MDKTEPFFGHFLVDPLLMPLFLRDDDILDTFLQKQFYFIAVLLLFFPHWYRIYHVRTESHFAGFLIFLTVSYSLKR